MCQTLTADLFCYSRQGLHITKIRVIFAFTLILSLSNYIIIMSTSDLPEKTAPVRRSRAIVKWLWLKDLEYGEKTENHGK